MASSSRRPRHRRPVPVPDGPQDEPLQPRDGAGGVGSRPTSPGPTPGLPDDPRSRARIEGRTVVSSFDITHDDPSFSTQALTGSMPAFPAVHQGGARYRWDGEEAVGMIERSYPLDRILR